MFIFLTRLGRTLIGIAVVVALTSLIGFGTLTDTIPVASKHQAGTSQLTLVLLNSTDGSPHWAQQVTFKVSTTKTTEPHVSLICSQNGTVVYQAQTGFYAGYPWPWTQTMTLSSAAWTGGAASCTASLYYFSGSRTTTLATLNFQVLA
jgi:hypothetical protein